MSKLRHFVTRMHIEESDVHMHVQKIQEQNMNIEKDLIMNTEVNESFAEHYEQVLIHFDDLLIRPIMEELRNHFWPLGAHIEHPLNPQHLVIMPDQTLSGLPLERFGSFLDLFGARNHSKISRDLSLHILAQRVREYVSDGDQPLKAKLPVVSKDATSLLSDANAEDALKPSEDPNGETMSDVHKRLADDKVVGSKSLHGQMWAASPEDITSLVADSTAMLFLGFGRFFTTMPAQYVSSQDMRHLYLLAIFGRCINDTAFRRQTKTDSMKTVRQVASEGPYGFMVLAAFRGVQSFLTSCSPMPTAINMRNLECFARAFSSGKTVGQALEDLLNERTKNPQLRYQRTLQGGVHPRPTGDASQVSQGGGSRAGSTEPPEESSEEDLLIFHTKASYVLCGVPWITVGEGSDAGGAAKKK